MSTTGERFERAVQIMARLRAPGGCPWDREQTFDTIKPYTLEETYEVLEAIDNRDWPELTGELGDLLLQVLFYSQMASEEGHFSVDDVLDRLSNKLVDRHPHVFGDVKADTPAEVLRNWEALKAEEKKKRLAARGENQAEQSDGAQVVDAQTGSEPSSSESSVLAGVSSKMPALMEAYKLSSRAAHVGFDWPEIEGLFAKLEEETEELREELKAVPTLHSKGQSSKGKSLGKGIAGSGKPQLPPELRERVEDEVGDLFFVLVNVARYLSLDPESALRKTNRKFKRRFQWMEERLRASERTPQQASMDELESLWQEAKQQEKPA
jgi:ATP diphosphatase